MARRKLREEVAALAEAVARLEREVTRRDDDAAERVQRASDVTRGELERVVEILRVVCDREPENRERLRRLRDSDDYERAFDEPDPLVSIAIPTFSAHAELATRSVPAALAQTHSNVELIVVGDAAPPETERALARIEDPRLRYVNRPYNGPYPEARRDAWHVSGVPPRNEAVALARGRWIVGLDDDDAMRPDHVERLLALARRERAEVAYGRLHCVMRSAADFELGAFPPRLGQFGWMAAIFHSGLRFFELELADALFSQPADWSLCRRMLRAGVRFAMLDEVVVDHHESTYSPDYDAT